MTREPRVKQAILTEVYSGYDYLLYKICFHGAPTVLRVKPSSLICFKNSSKCQLKDIWFNNREEVERSVPLSTFELKTCDRGVNVLFYDSQWLWNVLRRKKAKSYLESFGYDYSTLNEALEQLRSRYQSGCPDEIGVFLGYPLEDVMAFSSKDKGDSLMTGYWKVYNNLHKAKKVFAIYDRARETITTRLLRGVGPKDILAAI